MRNDLKDLCTSLYPNSNSENNHSFWTKNARKLFKAVVLGIIEDLEQQIKLAEVLTCEEEQKVIDNYLRYHPKKKGIGGLKRNINTKKIK